MKILLLTAALIFYASPAVQADDYTHGEPVYDLSGRVPLAYGKNKKGEDVVCEYVARTGSNLKTWTCQSRDDLNRAEIAAKKALQDAFDEKGVCYFCK